MTKFCSKNRQYFLEDLDVKHVDEHHEEASEKLTPLDYFMWGFYIAKKDPNLSEANFKKYVEMPTTTLRKKIRQGAKLQKFVDLLESLTEKDSTADTETATVNEKHDIKCCMCHEPVILEQSLTLKSCGHSYHKNCLAPSLKKSINCGMGNLGCLGKECEGVFALTEVWTLLGDEYYTKAKENSFGEATSPKRQMSTCPNPRCDHQFTYSGESLFSCPKCYKKYCLECRVESYIHGESCEDYRKMASRDTNFGFKAGQKFKECSQCRIWNEKSLDNKKIRCRCGTETCLDCGLPSYRCNCIPTVKIAYPHHNVMYGSGNVHSPYKSFSSHDHSVPYYGHSIHRFS